MKAHGILMMLAWMLIYVVLLLLVSARKEYVIDYSRKNWWFQTVRAVSIMTIVIMMIGILLVIIANRDNSSHGLISSSPCGSAIFHAVMGYIAPLTVVVCLVLFHVMIPPNHFRSKSFILIALLCVLCFVFAVSLVIFSVIFGLLLFQSGCALIDNLSLVLFVYLTFFLKFIAGCAKIVLVIIPNCCLKRHVWFPCCYRACPCTPNKLICFVWIVYLLMMAIIVIVMLVIMVLIAISPTLGYIGQ